MASDYRWVGWGGGGRQNPWQKKDPQNEYNTMVCKKSRILYFKAIRIRGKFIWQTLAPGALSGYLYDSFVIQRFSFLSFSTKVGVDLWHFYLFWQAMPAQSAPNLQPPLLKSEFW